MEKAKNLKKRIKSYFSNSKKVIFFKYINDFSFIITNSELESLILEQSLIKQYNPRFNILFKDDKHYPYIHISNEDYPRLSYLRKINKKKKGKFYGPFPDGIGAFEIFNLLNKIFPLRKCINMPKSSCIYYDLQQCLAPCIYEIDKNIYKNITKQIDNFFCGKTEWIENYLEQKINNSSKKYQYEKAKKYLKLLRNVRLIKNRTIIQFNDYVDRDILGFYIHEKVIYFCLLIFKSGKLINTIYRTFIFNDNINDLSNSFLYKFYKNNTLPKYIISKNIDFGLICKIYNIRNVKLKFKNKGFIFISMQKC